MFQFEPTCVYLGSKWGLSSLWSNKNDLILPEQHGVYQVIMDQNVTLLLHYKRRRLQGPLSSARLVT